MKGFGDLGKKAPLLPGGCWENYGESSFESRPPGSDLRLKAESEYFGPSCFALAEASASAHRTQLLHNVLSGTTLGFGVGMGSPHTYNM